MRINEHVSIVASGKMGMDWTHPSDCNVYVLQSEGEAALIDTGTGESIEAMYLHLKQEGIDPESITYIFLTHIHADHAGGASKLKRDLGAEVYANAEALSVLRSGDEEAIDLLQAKKAGFYPETYRFEGCEALPLKEGDQFQIGSLKVTVYDTPGHSRFDMAFHVQGENADYLFSGDTVLFDGKISMLYTKDFSIHDLSESISKLSRLDAEVLLPGHFQPALKNGKAHITKAKETFENMGIPKNIIE